MRRWKKKDEGRSIGQRAMGYVWLGAGITWARIPQCAPRCPVEWTTVTRCTAACHGACCDVMVEGALYVHTSQGCGTQTPTADSSQLGA
jgi:hypothetical protein